MDSERPVDEVIEEVRDDMREYWRAHAAPGFVAASICNRKGQRLAAAIPALLAEIERLRGIEAAASMFFPGWWRMRAAVIREACDHDDPGDARCFEAIAAALSPDAAKENGDA